MQRFGTACSGCRNGAVGRHRRDCAGVGDLADILGRAVEGGRLGGGRGAVLRGGARAAPQERQRAAGRLEDLAARGIQT